MMSRNPNPKPSSAPSWCAPLAAAGVLLGAVAVALAVTIACAARASTPAPSAGRPALTPELFETGHRLYEKQCAVCHGATGAGDGPAAYLLYPKPRDFTQREFRLVSTSTMQPTDEDLFLTITRGMPGSSMPSWEALTPQERWALVHYVRYLSGELQVQDDGQLAAISIDPGVVIQVPPETPKTAESSARGQAIYMQACALCHGPEGRGDGQQVMTDNLGYPIRPRDLTAGVFKGSSESRDLYLRIVAGLPGSPMPSYAGAYADEEIWSLVHYVQSLAPAGAEERVRMHPKTIRVRRMRGDLPGESSADIWRSVAPTHVALTPLWWRDERVEVVEVRALHNGQELALHLAWGDRTRDGSTLAPQTFSDGAAVEFSLEQDPPFFGMGAAGGTVQIWHWKASWQADVGGWQDVETAYPHAAVDWYQGQSDYRHGEPFEVSQAKTASQEPGFMGGWGAGNPLSDPTRGSAAEEALAQGLGTLTPKAPMLQRVQAAGQWRDGQWQVVLRRPLAPAGEGDLGLRVGEAARVAFAVFDGSAKDRNGQKSVSIWHVLALDR